jgi:hypothetical protein
MIEQIDDNSSEPIGQVQFVHSNLFHPAIIDAANNYKEPVDPEDPKRKQAVALAKRMGIEKELISGENTTIGTEIPKFYDEAGRDITGRPAQKPNIKLQTYVPKGISELLEDDTGYPYFEDPQTGEQVHVPQDYRYLPRFNPKRGKSNDDLIAKK